jgi:5'-nucleotidase
MIQKGETTRKEVIEKSHIALRGRFNLKPKLKERRVEMRREFELLQGLTSSNFVKNLSTKNLCGRTKMKKLIILISLIGILGIFSLAQAQVDTLTILHLNDTHSHILPYGPKDAEGNWTWGGMARIATLVGMNRMSANKLMLLHAGDVFLGDFMFQKYLGVAELDIMKALEYDALAVGNHEFDLYPSTLKYVLNEAGFPGEGFPVLCANLDLSGDPELAYFVQPYTIKEYGDFKIGIFALLTETTNQISNPSPVVVLPAIDYAQEWVDTLKAHNCDIIILLSHLGFEYEQLVASSVSGIDIIVGGHSHDILTSPAQIGNTLLLQAGEFGRYLGKLTLYLDNEDIQSWDYELQSVDSSVPEEPTLAFMIAGLASEVEANPWFGPVYTEVIAQAGNEIKKPLGEGLFKDTPLGNLVSDAFRDKTETDIAFYPQGFCSQTIYPGPVKGADIFQAIPYGFDPATGLGFKLATFETDGMSIIYGLEFAVYNLPYAEDFFLHSSNFSYAYNSSNLPGSRIDYSSISVNGLPLDPFASYTVTVPDGVVPFLGQIPGFQINDLVITEDFMYYVVRDFMISGSWEQSFCQVNKKSSIMCSSTRPGISCSGICYYAEGRVIDIALFSIPEEGVVALLEAVDQCFENGSIDNSGIAKGLKSKLNDVYSLLQTGRCNEALAALKAFKKQVRAQSGKHISSETAVRLVYLADKLGENIWNSPFTAKGIETNAVPDDFQLLQNYPNPFNPQTEIAYHLPCDTHVKLTVYNILGQQVKVLVDEHQSAGTRSVIWDGHDQNGEKVSSGIYLYKLQAEELTQTKKMSLLK